MASKFQGNANQGFNVEYTPTEVGRHRINVEYADIDISDSPFFPQAFDAGLVRVGTIPDGVLGQPVTFEGKHHISLNILLLMMTFLWFQ